MVQVVGEKVQRAHLREDATGYLFVACKYFVQRVGVEFHARLQVEEFTEGEAAQVVAVHHVANLRVFVQQAHHRRAGKHNLQSRKAVVALAQLVVPPRVLEHLVDEQHPSPAPLEGIGKLHDAVSREVEVVHVDEQARAVCAELFFGILQQEGRLAHATRAFDADEAVAPVYLVHQVAADGSIGVFHQVGVSAVKCFHVFVGAQLIGHKYR